MLRAALGSSRGSRSLLKLMSPCCASLPSPQRYLEIVCRSPLLCCAQSSQSMVQRLRFPQIFEVFKVKKKKCPGRDRPLHLGGLARPKCRGPVARTNLIAPQIHPVPPPPPP